MEQESKDLKTFVRTFFTHLGCRIIDEDGILLVEKVSPEFEQFCGKKGPYRFRFEKDGNGESEFITKGSTLLKSMMQYLDKHSQTTLIKLHFDRDYKQEIAQYFQFRNAEISSFTKKVVYKPFVRFSIATILQYLNEREQITNQVCVYDGNIINFSLDRFTHSAGIASEINPPDFKEEYALAKTEVRNRVKRRVEETATVLSEKLDSEIARVKNHYVKQKHEIRENEIKFNLQKQKLQDELKNASDSEWKQIQNRIKKINQSLKELKSSDALVKMQKEEDFFVNDEKQKHSLRITNKLMNTSILYYPIFTFEVYLKAGKTSKRIEIQYEPFLDEIQKGISCESCERDIREIYVCSSGHVSCASCIERCSMCQSTLCVSCSKKWCDLCGRKLCGDCIVRCSGCHKHICTMHAQKDYRTDKPFCVQCLVKCGACGQFTQKKHMRQSNEGEICEKCFRLRGLKTFKN